MGSDGRSQGTIGTGVHWTLVDTHVHIHDCFPMARVFDAASANFRRIGKECGYADSASGMALLLTETAGVHRFSQLRSIAAGSAAGRSDLIGDWRVTLTDEEYSLRLTGVGGVDIMVIAGRQIVTREKLELLALLTDKEFPDGEEVDISLRQIQMAGAIPVLPWGFGKWLGKRGEIVHRLIRDGATTSLCLGDNSGRLRHWPPPQEFELASRNNIHVLPGSDPLPFPGQESRIGSFGCAIQDQLPNTAPGERLKTTLGNPNARLQPFGRLEGLYPFLRNQTAMQIHKRRRNRTQPVSTSGNATD